MLFFWETCILITEYRPHGYKRIYFILMPEQRETSPLCLGSQSKNWPVPWNVKYYLSHEYSQWGFDKYRERRKKALDQWLHGREWQLWFQWKPVQTKPVMRNQAWAVHRLRISQRWAERSWRKINSPRHISVSCLIRRCGLWHLAGFTLRKASSLFYI